MAEMTTKVLTASAEETRRAGARLAAAARAGDVFSLDGDLGCGKTEFARGFVGALSSGAEVRSPTFSIVNTYPAPEFPVHHFDFYRIEDARELAAIGIDEYLCGDGVCLIEWGGLHPEVLPETAKRIRFTETGGGARMIEAAFAF